MDNDVVCLIESGKLGDHLLYSTLPELYWKQRKRAFYLSHKCVADNQEILDLWVSNPYYKGISTKQPNAGSHAIINDITPDSETNIIHQIEENHGLNPENKYPKIHYSPVFNPYWSEKIVINICIDDSVNKITYYHQNKELLHEVITDLLKHEKASDVFTLRFSNIPVKSVLDLSYKQYIIEGLHELMNVVFSCKRFICLNGGSYMTACAIRDKNKQLARIDCIAGADKVFKFDNADVYSLEDVKKNYK